MKRTLVCKKAIAVVLTAVTLSSLCPESLLASAAAMMEAQSETSETEQETEQEEEQGTEQSTEQEAEQELNPETEPIEEDVPAPEAQQEETEMESPEEGTETENPPEEEMNPVEMPEDSLEENPDVFESIEDTPTASDASSLVETDTLTSSGDFTIDDNGVLTAYTGMSVAVVIPEGVTEIYRNVFKDHEEIVSVVIPDSVTCIGTGAFSGCTLLTDVKLSSNLKELGYSSFGDCPSLTSIFIPKSLEDTIPVYDHGGPFYNSTSLTNVTFEEGMTKIPRYLFENCRGLTSINIPETVTDIEACAFQGCENLRSISLPEGIGSINSHTFAKCTSLESIEIPDNVTVIAGSAFSGCTSLKNVKLSNNLKELNGSSFGQCTSLTSIVIPKSLDSVSGYGTNHTGPFKDCTNLMEAILEDGISKVPIYLFSGCEGLEKIVVPKSVTVIESGAFWGCSSLADIVLPESVELIDSNAFIDCVSLESIKIPDSVIEIGTSAFSGCTALKDIELSHNLKEIGCGCFKDCPSLTSIEIPKSLEVVNAVYTTRGPFLKSTTLTNVTFEEGTSRIPRYLFEECLGLVGIEIPDTVTEIGNQAFFGCSKLEQITIPQHVTVIGDNVFYKCTELKSIYFKGDAPNIGRTIFSGVIATAYYPSGNSTWTDDIKQDYGGTITWVEWDPDGDTEVPDDEPTVVVGDNTEEEEIEIKLGSDVSFEIPEGFPIECMVGGEIEMKFKDLIPVQCEREGNTFRIGIGTKDLKNFSSSDWFNFKKFVEKQDEEYSKGLNSLLAAQEGVASIGMEVKPKISCYGYFEGVITENGIESGGGRFSLAFTVKAEQQWQTIIVVVPVVLKLEGKAEIETNTSLGLDLDKMELYIKGDHDLILPELELSTGVGMAHTVDISVYGSLENKVNLKSNETLPQCLDITATISGEMGVSATFLFWSYKKPIFEGDPWTYYSYKADEEIGPGSGGGGGTSWGDTDESDGGMSGDGNGGGGGSALSYYEPPAYLTAASLQDAEPAQSAGEEVEWEITRTEVDSEWNGSMSNTGVSAFSLSDTTASGDICTLQSGVYENAEPILVQTDSGKEMLVYTADIAARSMGNHTAVCYSVFDDTTGAWGEPVILEDDGTSDFDPAVAVNGEDVYIAWVNANRAFTEEEAASENFIEMLLSACEIRLAKINAASGSAEFYSITDNESADLEPAVAVIDGQVSIAWYENTGNDLLSGGSNNVLYLAAVNNGIAAVNYEETVTKNITATAVGKLGGSIAAAYVLSETGLDSEAFLSGTAQETSLLLADSSGNTREIKNGGIHAAPAFISADTGGQLLWYELLNGTASLRYTDSMAGESQCWLTGDAFLTPDYTIIEGEGSQLLVCASDNADAEKDGRDLHAYVIAKQQICEPVTLTEVEGYTENPSGIWDGDSYVFLFTRTDVVFSETIETSTDMCITSVTPDSCLRIEDIDYTEQSLMPGAAEEMIVTVRNDGLGNSETAAIQLLYEDAVIGETVLSETLAPGASAEITLDAAVPETVPEHAVFTVQAISGEKAEPDTKAVQLSGATADLELTVSEEEDTVTVTALNDSVFDTTATLYISEATGLDNAGSVIYAGDASDTNSVLYKADLGSIAAHGSITKTFSRTELQNLGAKALYLEVGTGEAENIFSNNYDYIYVGDDALKDLSHLIVSKKKVSYQVGDILNLDDMEVKAVYTDGTETVVTDYETNANELDMSAAGVQTLIITYGEVYQKRKAEMDILVSEKTEDTGTEVTKGDINSDGIINVRDLMLCLYHVSGKTPLTGDAFTAADIDGNGSVVITDLMKLLYYVSGKNAEL